MNDYQIFKNIQKHTSLNDREKQLLLSSLVVKNVQKKDLILKQGHICNKLYFVESGSLRAYNLNDDGKESTIMFAIKDWWITDMNCFINKKPAVLSIEALELSKIVALDYHSLKELYLEIPKFERFFRILFQNANIREQFRALITYH